MKTPNIKHQTPTNLQIANTERVVTNRARHWGLEVGVYLVFGVSAAL
jgi:hypothetical protein